MSLYDLSVGETTTERIEKHIPKESLQGRFYDECFTIVADKLDEYAARILDLEHSLAEKEKALARTIGLLT